jgi:hypothetical protein
MPALVLASRPVNGPPHEKPAGPPEALRMWYYLLIGGIVVVIIVLVVVRSRQSG